jgi:predicted metalloprotease with PDZ domain
MASHSSDAIRYRIEVADLHAHLLRVTLTIPRPQPVQRVSLPVWIPGSYMVREFSGQLQKLQARQRRRELTVHTIDKCSWQVEANPAQALTLSCEVYAHDPSVRTALLNHERGFFNATSLCLQVQGQESQPHLLEVPPPRGLKDWTLATGLTPESVDARGFGTYSAADYDELADCPVTMGRLWSGQFKVGGVAHQFVVSGAAPSFDGERLLADTRAICETQIRFWHGQRKPPFKRYVFMLHAVHEGYGGLEHRNSTALICGRRDLPVQGESKVSEGYTTLRGLISHEYFHTWNVKRLRPAEFARYDYSRENYTRLLWFFEGFTSYYDDLLLRRAGLLDNAGYLKLLNKTINQVMQTPGRAVQSVAEASFDAWVKYYRQSDNTPNATVSYYTKGALVALCFDLSLRQTGRSNLDEVMRMLWLRCQAGPMTEDDFAQALQEAGGRRFDEELAHWVHGRDELPLKPLLQAQGVAVMEDPAQLAQRLGLRASDGPFVSIKTVLHGGPAHAAGLSAGDEWLGVAVPGGGRWRLQKLDDLSLYGLPGQTLSAIVARDQQILELPLTLPPPSTTWRLAVQDAARLDEWLAGASRHGIIA